MLFLSMLILYIAAMIFLVFTIRKWLSAVAAETNRRIPSRLSLLTLIPAALPIAGAFCHPAFNPYLLTRAGNLWLCFCLYLFLSLIVLFAARSICRHAKKARSGIRRPRLLAGTIIIVLCALITAGGVFHAFQTKTTRYTIQSDKLTNGPIRIVFAADLHLGSQVGLTRVRAMVTRINEANPDLVLFGGDIFDSSYDSVSDPALIAGAFREIQSKYGVYTVYGNHDVSETLVGGFSISPEQYAFRDPRMAEFLSMSGIQTLADQTVSLADGSVCLAGRLDGEKAGDGTSNRLSVPQLMEKIDPNAFVIALEHEPVDLEELGASGADLVLCGHTHDGQYFPANLIQKLLWDNSFGLKKFGSMTSIVTAGFGLYGPPVRIGTDSEIVQIDVE